MESIASFTQAAQQTKLTPKERLVVDYIINNLSAVCYLSTGELAHILGVSDTTVIRTSRALGYSSFLELQEQLRACLMQSIEDARRIFTSPFERLQAQHAAGPHTELSKRFAEMVQRNLDSVFQKNTDQTLEQVVDLLTGCRIKYIVGQRPTANLAEKFSFLLRMTVKGVVACTGSVTFEQLLDIGPEDCLFVIDFNQYSAAAQQYLDYGHSRGAKIVLLTDRPTAPFAYLADILLLVDVNSLSFFNSQAAATVLLELLVTMAANRPDASASERLNTLTPYFNMHRLNGGTQAKSNP